MKLFSDCSGPCKTCLYYYIGTYCLAGHGDDHYEHVTEEWIKQHQEQVNG